MQLLHPVRHASSWQASQPTGPRTEEPALRSYSVLAPVTALDQEAAPASKDRVCDRSIRVEFVCRFYEGYQRKRDAVIGNRCHMLRFLGCGGNREKVSHVTVCLALLCFALHCFALHCFALLCFALLSYALLCFALHCFALLCFALLCLALHCFALHCFALLCIALHCFALICFALLC